MPQPASTRLGLIAPSGTDALSIGDDQIRAIVTQLEAVGAGYIVDVAANRPAAAAATKGFAFIASDTGVVSFCTGSAWVDAQPHDSDLDAIAALSTTSIGRSLLAASDAAALRTILALGTAATQASTAFDAAGAAAAAQAASQPIDSDLTAIAALATASFGRALLTKTNAAAVFASLGIAYGHVSVTYSASQISNVQPVTHGLTGTPSTVVAIQSNDGDGRIAQVGVSNIDGTGFNLQARDYSGSGTTKTSTVYWLAIV